MFRAVNGSKQKFFPLLFLVPIKSKLLSNFIRECSRVANVNAVGKIAGHQFRIHMAAWNLVISANYRHSSPSMFAGACFNSESILRWKLSFMPVSCKFVDTAESISERLHHHPIWLQLVSPEGFDAEIYANVSVINSVWESIFVECISAGRNVVNWI